MKKFTFALSAICMALLLAVGWVGQANAASIVGSDHDFLAHYAGSSAVFGGPTGTTPVNQICVFCHTPHFATSTQPPLWNRSDPVTTSWTMYNSPTLDATPPLAPQGVSLGCLSCHDGVTAIDAGTGITFFVPGFTSPTMTDLGAIGHIIAESGDLSNDHPLSITYGLDPDLVPASGNQVDILPLFGPSGDQLECATCHNPHDPANHAFLRKSNNQAGNPSGLCFTCHLK